MTATTTPRPKRGRRFHRPAEPPAFEFTERDKTIILAVARHRFASSIQIPLLVGGSPENLLERLKLLWRAGYLDRPRAQIDYYSNQGLKPFVYAITKIGAEQLDPDDLDLRLDVEWSLKNRAVGRQHINHTLAVTDLNAALLKALRTHPDVQLIDRGELKRTFPQPPASPDRAFSWKTKLSHNNEQHTVTVNPDCVFALRSPTISRRCYLAECDRGTMPQKRSDFSQTSIQRKFSAYVQGYLLKLHEQQFGWKACRILFVAKTEERANRSRQTLQEVTSAPTLRRVFYFSHAEAIKSDILTHQWIDGNGEPQVLI